jgi:hypothetical protein
MPDDPSLPPRSRGATARRRDQMATSGEATLPRRPDERDESPDSQGEGVRPVMRQAAEDVMHGQQDTGRKPVLDRAYEAQKGAGAAGAPAEPDASGAGVHKTDAGHGPGDRRSATTRNPRGG